MTTKQGRYPAACRHQNDGGSTGSMALVSIGNTLRADDGVAQAVCAALPPSTMKQVCYFDLGTYSHWLTSAVQGHKAAIIIDAMVPESCPGKVTVLDLQQVISAKTPLKFSFSHGISLVDELKIASWRTLLPESLIFIGIEAAGDEWSEKLSRQLQGKLPEIISAVDFVVKKQLGDLAIHA